MKGKIFNLVRKPIKEFLSFDKDVINYMIMHWCGGVFLIYASLIPVLMNKMGLSIINAGIIFSIAAIFDVLLTFILRKVFDRVSPNTGMALDWLTESLPAIIFGFASTGFHFMLGGLAQKVTNILNPVYKIYENEIFPEKNRSLVYTYHFITPEIFTVIIYPIVGYLLTYKFTEIIHLRYVFFICGIGYLFVALIPLKKLKRVEPTKIIFNKTKSHIPKKLYLGASAQIFVLIGLGLTSTLLTSYYILEKMNGSIMDILMLEVVRAIVVLITGMFTKNLNKYISDEKIAQYGIVFFMIFALLMVIANNYTIVLIAFVFQAIGDTIWFPSHSSLLMEYVPKSIRGEFFASLSSAGKLVNVLLPIISGLLAKYFGFFIPFCMAFVMFIIVCFIYQKLLKQI